MSSDILKLIPSSPEYVPDEGAQRHIYDLFASCVPRAIVHSEVTEEVRFIDQGANWERVVCPACGAEIDTEWWQKSMDIAYQTKFTALLVDTPCCGKRYSLNDLCYEWPAGFARFVIEVHNLGMDINDNMVYSLEQILGCKLRKIWAHY